MKRFEIIANLAVQEDIIETFTQLGLGEAFSYFYPVYGRGKKGRREGSAVWPETNVMFLIYTDANSAETLTRSIVELKERFPQEGIKCWMSNGPEVSV